MLVLSRRIGEEVIINDNISIKIVSIQGNKVRVAISAPADVPIDRAEIHQRRNEFIASDAESDLGSDALSCSGL